MWNRNILVIGCGTHYNLLQTNCEFFPIETEVDYRNVSNVQLTSETSPGGLLVLERQNFLFCKRKAEFSLLREVNF